MPQRRMPHGVKVGDTIRITKLDDPYDKSYVGREGVVEFIDSMDQIHGSWGGLALIPGEDDFIVIKRADSYARGFTCFLTPGTTRAAAIAALF